MPLKLFYCIWFNVVNICYLCFILLCSVYFEQTIIYKVIVPDVIFFGSQQVNDESIYSLSFNSILLSNDGVEDKQMSLRPNSKISKWLLTHLINSGTTENVEIKEDFFCIHYKFSKWQWKTKPNLAILLHLLELLVSSVTLCDYSNAFF